LNLAKNAVKPPNKLTNDTYINRGVSGEFPDQFAVACARISGLITLLDNAKEPGIERL
jgi:hypothetical protein